MAIQIKNEDILIRPSSVDNFYQCSYQWGKVFLEGVTSIPNSRAAIGTSIHAGVEQMWNESIKSKQKAPSLGAMTDAAMDAWKEEKQKGLRFDSGEDDGTCSVEIVKGIEAFNEDILPFADIPKAVEKFYEVPLDHQLVRGLGGTVDYIADGIIADVKTSKRKPSVANYKTQQSIYKYLANANGENVKHNLIHSVVLKKQPDGAILGMDTDIDQAKGLINVMLDTLDLIAKDVAPAETILRGNPKYYLCSEKYCALYNNCPFVKGDA